MRLPPSLGFALLLAACGGGDGSSTATAPAAAAPTPPATAAESACGLPDFQADMLRRVNARRATGASCGSSGTFAAAPALAWSDTLTTAAYAHARDMAGRNYFSHTGPDGRGVGERASDAGYAWRAVGENIAAGQRTVAEVVDGWMASPGHCANLMNPGMRDLGAACAADAASTFGTYWTLVIAR